MKTSTRLACQLRSMLGKRPDRAKSIRRAIQQVTSAQLLAFGQLGRRWSQPAPLQRHRRNPATAAVESSTSGVSFAQPAFQAYSRSARHRPNTLAEITDHLCDILVVAHQPLLAEQAERLMAALQLITPKVMLRSRVGLGDRIANRIRPYRIAIRMEPRWLNEESKPRWLSHLAKFPEAYHVSNIVKILKEMVSSPTMTRSGLLSRNDLRKLTYKDLVSHFTQLYRKEVIYQTSGDKIIAFHLKAVRDEAAEVLYGLHPRSSGLTKKYPEDEARRRGSLGRICKYCWRTEEFSLGEEVYGTCHMHNPHALALRESRKRREPDAAKRYEDIVRAIGRAEDLRRLLKEQGVINKYGYFMRVETGHLLSSADMGDWPAFVRTHFPHAFDQVLEELGPKVLTNFIATVEALEGRKLSQAELAKESYVRPCDALPVLQRCETWSKGLASASRVNQRRKLEMGCAKSG